MPSFSQRDPRWSSIRLGTGSTNTSTIGSHGCTITCVGMLAGITPKEVNERLNSVGGFASSKATPQTFNLILWQKIQHAIPWLKFEWRGYSYEDDRVKAAIQNNGLCLVGVDGSKIGGNQKDGHWVSAVGGGLIIDPWDGGGKPFNHYPATGYAIINVVGQKPTVPEGTTMNEFEKQLKELMAMYGKGSFNDLKAFLIDHLGENGQGGFLASERIALASIRSILGLSSTAQLSTILDTIKSLKDGQLPGQNETGNGQTSLPTIEGFELDSITFKKKAQ